MTKLIGLVILLLVAAVFSTALWIVYQVVLHGHYGTPSVTWTDFYILYLAMHVARGKLTVTPAPVTTG